MLRIIKYLLICKFRIVGDDDGGSLFTPEQYEHHKKTVVAKRINNRLFVSWAAKVSGIECIMVGPETKCFCQHRCLFVLHFLLLESFFR